MMPYLLLKFRFGIIFFAKTNTIMLLCKYQVYISARTSSFFPHFFLTLMELFFWRTIAQEPAMHIPSLLLRSFSNSRTPLVSLSGLNESDSLRRFGKVDYRSNDNPFNKTNFYSASKSILSTVESRNNGSQGTNHFYPL